MKPTVYYHHWIGKAEKPAYNNLRVPVLLSIATLRAVNPTIPIVVLEDETSEPQPDDWLHFPDLLKFEVRPIPFFLERHYPHIIGHRFLSRLFDLRRHAHGDVIYCDSDVFWFRDPLPLSCDSDRFCFDGYNTGFFYYRPSDCLEQLFEIFEGYTIGALNNQEIRQLMKRYVGYETWQEVWDEMTMTFIANEHSSLIHRIPAEEHVTVKNMPYVNLAKMKMLHCNGLLVANPVYKVASEKDHCRGLLCLIVKELFGLLQSVLNESDLKLIFTPQERQYYRTMQIPFTEPKTAQRLWETRSEDGHFHMQKLCGELLKSQRLL